MDGTVAAADDPPAVLGRMPPAFVQQMGPRLRPGRLLRFRIGPGGIYFQDGQPVGAMNNVWCSALDWPVAWARHAVLRVDGVMGLEVVGWQERKQWQTAARAATSITSIRLAIRRLK